MIFLYCNFFYAFSICYAIDGWANWKHYRIIYGALLCRFDSYSCFTRKLIIFINNIWFIKKIVSSLYFRASTNISLRNRKLLSISYSFFNIVFLSHIIRLVLNPSKISPKPTELARLTSIISTHVKSMTRLIFQPNYYSTSY